MTITRRSTELTVQQRMFLDRIRAEGAKHFPGETVPIYFPKQAMECRERLHRQIAELLAAKVPQREIRRRTGASFGLICTINGRVRRGTFGALSFPP